MPSSKPPASRLAGPAHPIASNPARHRTLGPLLVVTMLATAGCSSGALLHSEAQVARKAEGSDDRTRAPVQPVLAPSAPLPPIRPTEAQPIFAQPVFRSWPTTADTTAGTRASTGPTPAPSAGPLKQASPARSPQSGPDRTNRTSPPASADAVIIFTVTPTGSCSACQNVKLTVAPSGEVLIERSGWNAEHKWRYKRSSTKASHDRVAAFARTLAVDRPLGRQEATALDSACQGSTTGGWTVEWIEAGRRDMLIVGRECTGRGGDLAERLRHAPDLLGLGKRIPPS